MIVLTLSPCTSLLVTDSQNNTAPDRMKINMLKKNINPQYFNVTTRRHKDIWSFTGQQHLHQNRGKIAIKNYPADMASDMFWVCCTISMQLEFCIQYPSPLDLEKKSFPFVPL